MLEVQPKDSRQYFMLPQAPEDAGYYVYGLLHNKPSHGASHYAHPSLMTAILRIEREWQSIDSRKFGIGDISLAGGQDHPEHDSHESGLEVDIRPIRKDGLHKPVFINDRQYDNHATAKLIELFFIYGNVKTILFNDVRIPFVKKASNHDNHFHVKIWG